MKTAKQKASKVVEFFAIKSAKIACGTASFNYFCQPKEPETLNKFFSKK